MDKVTKNVIMDLMPLYLAGEVSEDTAALVKTYIDTNPEMADIVNKMEKAESLGAAPDVFSKEIAMTTFQAAKKWTVIRTLGLATIIGLCWLSSLVLTLAFFYFMKYGGP
jgi:hypothetical protein